MNVEQDEPKPERHITWRTQITIHTEPRGLVSRQTVDRAVNGVHHVAPTIDIAIVGGCNIVDFDAAMPLGHLLHRAQEVNVTAHGPGVPHLLDAIQFAVRHEQEFRTELAAAQSRRAQASPAYNPWQPIGEQA